VILLSTLCANISKTTAQTSNDSIKLPERAALDSVAAKAPVLEPMVIPAEQVVNIYIGLRRGKIAEQRFAECMQTARQLNDIIQKQNQEAQTAASSLTDLNSKLSEAEAEKLKNAVLIQELKDRKTPWYRHPVTYFVAGMATGIYITFCGL